MNESRAFKRYAEAFFDLMSEKNLVDAAIADLREILRYYQEVEDFKILMEHQGIPAGSKKDTLRKLFEGIVQSLTLNFLFLLCDKHREAGLPDICQHFFTLDQQARNVAEAFVRSAVPLSEEDLEAVRLRLCQVTGSEIRVNYHVDPSLLGGVVARIGDRVYDGSLAHRLSRLKEHIMGQGLDELRGDRAG